MNSVLARLGIPRVEDAAERRKRDLRAHVTFPDLAWDHFHWEKQRRTGICESQEAADRYLETRAAFEARYGEIVGEYWSIREPSGVAVTRKPAPRLLQIAVDDKYRFHRATDWVTRDVPAVAELLYRCEILAIQVTEVLRHASESIAVRRVLAVASHLLGFLDRPEGRSAEAEAAEVKTHEAELKKIEDYFALAGRRIGHIIYTWGMVIGLLVLAAMLAAVTVPLWRLGPLDWNDMGTQNVLVAFGAGAFGAFVSVLQRMAADKFSVHYDLGKRSLYMLGSYRPLLGAVFGVFSYLVVASGVLQVEASKDSALPLLYGSLAFVAGFSERFTKVLMTKVEDTASPEAAPASAEEGAA